MPLRLVAFCIVVASGIALGARAETCANDDTPAKPDPAVVRQLVEQLASNDFATREWATQALSELSEVPAALVEATKSNDPEVGQRAQTLAALITARAEDRVLKQWVQWAQVTDFSSNAPHDPLVVGDQVVVGTDRGHLRAYRCLDGKSAWVHQHGARIFHRPCDDGRRIYFSSERGITAVKVEDGTHVWSCGMTCCDGPTLVLDKQGTVFVGGNDGILYALDARTGDQVWASDFIADAPPDPPGFSGERARLSNTKARPSALATDGQTVFLSVFDQCRMIAVNAADGKRLWSFQTGGWVFGTAAATDKHVFIGSQDKTFYCLDKQTGRKVWSYETKGRIETGGSVDDEFVYFGSCDGNLYCLNQHDGTLRWRFTTDKREGHNSAIYSVPVLHQGGVYFAAGDGQAYALDQQTGELKWKVRPSKGAEMYCSPATDGALFFVVTRAAHEGGGEPSLVAIRF